MKGHWRPSLGLVLGCALAATLVLAFVGLVALRYLGPAIGFKNAALILGAIIAAATAILGLLLIRLLLRPIRALERYAAEVELGGDAMPPEHVGTEELRQTTLSVIEMATVLRDRETTVRSYTDHVTHELKTPVSGIRAAVELLEDSRDLSDEDRRLLGEIDGARKEIEQRLEALRRAAKLRETRYIGETRLDTLLPKLADEHPALSLKVEGGGVAIPLAEEGARIVLGQLLRNAAESGAKNVLLNARVNGACTLIVSDDGPGVSKGNAERIFEPFFTSRREAGGTGMGLAIAKNIITAHRGQIDLLESPMGAKFRISFAKNR